MAYVIFKQKMSDTECRQVEPGTIFRLFDAKCTKYLFNYPYNGPLAPAAFRHLVNPYKWNLARSDRKAKWITEEGKNQVAVCDPDNVSKPFSKKHFMLRIKVKVPLRCPYNKKTYISCSSVYHESTNPSNTVTSEPQYREQLWDPAATSMTFGMSPPGIGDPHGYGSGGQGSCEAILTIVDPDPESSCGQLTIQIDFYLRSLGMPWDYLAGTPEHQIRTPTCDSLQEGYGNYAFWTGVAFPRGPVGLVMVLDCSIWGRYENT
jgi:hypothetical protein